MSLVILPVVVIDLSIVCLAHEERCVCEKFDWICSQKEVKSFFLLFFPRMFASLGFIRLLCTCRDFLLFFNLTLSLSLYQSPCGLIVSFFIDSLYSLDRLPNINCFYIPGCISWETRVSNYVSDGTYTRGAERR